MVVDRFSAEKTDLAWMSLEDFLCNFFYFLFFIILIESLKSHFLNIFLLTAETLGIEAAFGRDLSLDVFANHIPTGQLAAVVGPV